MGREPPYCDEYLHGALVCALSRGYEEIFRFLVSEGVWLEYQNPKLGKTVLHLASQLQYPAMTQILLVHGAEVEARCAAGRTALHYCSNSPNRWESLMLLLEFDADVHARDIQENTPLHWAAVRRNLNGVRLLLVYGADRDARNAFGLTPLERAQLLGCFDWSVAHELHPEAYP